MNHETAITYNQHSRKDRLLLALFLLLYALIFAVRLPKLVFTGQWVLLSQAVVYGILGIGSIFLFRHELRAGLRGWKSSALKNILWVIAAFVANTFITNIAVYPAYIGGFADLLDNAGVALMVQAIGRLPAILVIGLAAPIVEECVYRAFLIGKLKTKIPLWVCVALSSVLFALAHMQRISTGDFLCALPGLTTGLVYGFVYAKTGNITLPIIMHIANNMTGIVLGS
ncbi:MAG: CPBP family intramembrane metalloprotease [Christensenellaceae bacterium]|jgi:membrane protease YdiL (CAAX protease family)|nr:CPBP family intramembrane metalloprotease [Christensenellaceae bacterium]